MAFDTSCILGPFTAFKRDANGTVTQTLTGDVYMVDANLIAEALRGLTGTQQTTAEGYIYNPTAQEILDWNLPVWAGNDPPARYVRVPNDATLAKAKAFFRNRYRDDS